MKSQCALQWQEGEPEEILLVGTDWKVGEKTGLLPLSSHQGQALTDSVLRVTCLGRVTDFHLRAWWAFLDEDRKTVSPDLQFMV